MLRKLIVFTVLLLSLNAASSEAQQRTSSDSSGRFFDLSSLLGINRYPNYRPPYYGSNYPGMYPGTYGGAGAYPGSYGGQYPGSYPTAGGYPGGYGTNFIGQGGYGGNGGNNGLDSYYGYQNKDYRGGGNLGYGYYSPDVFENRNTQPQSIPSGYRGYN